MGRRGIVTHRRIFHFYFGTHIEDIYSILELESEKTNHAGIALERILADVLLHIARAISQLSPILGVYTMSQSLKVREVVRKA